MILAWIVVATLWMVAVTCWIVMVQRKVGGGLISLSLTRSAPLPTAPRALRGYWWGALVGAGVWIPVGIGLERVFN